MGVFFVFCTILFLLLGGLLRVIGKDLIFWC